MDFLSFGPNDFWPLIILVLGLIFELTFFLGNGKVGLLVPGGILTTLGLLFFFETATDWRFAAYTWPVYILAVAVGLTQLYLFSTRPKGLLIPIFILVATAGISILSMAARGVMMAFNLSIIIPVILIGAGIVLFLRRDGNRKF